MTDTIDQDTSRAAEATHDGAVRGRRISWATLYRLRPDLKPANDNAIAIVEAGREPAHVA